MSNPYERVLSSRVSRQPENAKHQSRQQREKDPRPAPSSKPLSQPSKRRPVERPSNLRYAVRPRYRFDLPDPPMDPKMLLGKLSTASYAKPFLSDLERDFRIQAIPSDPTFGLHANLVDTSLYSKSPKLSVEDSALLHSVMAGRKGGNELTQPDSQGAKKQGAIQPPDPSVTVAEPWMRRMSYDEYAARDSSAPRQSLFLKDAAAKKRVQDKISAPGLQKRRLQSLLQSFDAVNRNVRHPDRRKQHLRPVSISPILPDFGTLGEELIALEFDKDDELTLSTRAKKDPEIAEESVRSTATVSVAEALVSGQERRYAVVYTPTVGTLEKRKRKREEAQNSDSDTSSKKIHFLDDETYKWVGEYSIREGRFGGAYEKSGLSRSCFAVTEHANKKGSGGVACLTRITTNWKLHTRVQADTPSRLGKEGLKITRSPNSSTVEENVKRDILSGAAGAKATEERERKRRIDMLEEE